MEFCPNCGMRLISIPKKKGKKVVLQLTCPKCRYKERTEHTPAAVPKVIERVPQDSIVVIGKREQKLQTLPTVRMLCPRCKKKHFYVWMVQIRRLEESSTQFFRCTRCNYTFRESG